MSSEADFFVASSMASGDPLSSVLFQLLVRASEKQRSLRANRRDPELLLLAAPLRRLGRRAVAGLARFVIVASR